MAASDVQELLAVRRELARLRSYRALSGWCDAERLRFFHLMAAEGELVANLTAQDRDDLAAR